MARSRSRSRRYERRRGQCPGLPHQLGTTARPIAVVAHIRVARSTTWLFVSTKPSGANTNPDPLDVAGRPSRWRARPRRGGTGTATSRCTTAGATRSTTSVTAAEYASRRPRSRSASDRAPPSSCRSTASFEINVNVLGHPSQDRFQKLPTGEGCCGKTAEDLFEPQRAQRHRGSQRVRLGASTPFATSPNCWRNGRSGGSVVAAMLRLRQEIETQRSQRSRRTA